MGEVSAKTRERALTLAENAAGINLHVGNCRRSKDQDFLAFFLTNGAAVSVIFCTPSGYLVEYWESNHGILLAPEFSCVKNIRHYLYTLRKENFISFDKYYEDLADLVDFNAADIKEILEEFFGD